MILSEISYCRALLMRKYARMSIAVSRRHSDIPGVSGILEEVVRLVILTIAVDCA